MGELVDSTDRMISREALLDAIRTDGYLFLRGIFPRASVLAVRAQILAVLARHGWIDGSQPPDRALAVPEKACFDPQPQFLEAYREIYVIEALHALIHEQRVIALLRGIYDGEVLPHPMIIPRVIFPQRPDIDTPAHQDYPAIQGPPDAYSAWVPLGDYRRDDGVLELAAGSHREGVRQFRVTTGTGGLEVVDPLTDSWVSSDVRAGDLILFDMLTVHRARPNRSDAIRLSVDTRYQRAGDPIVAGNLSPYANLMTWDQVYDGWTSDRLEHYWRHPKPRLVAFDRHWFDIRDRMAFEMAEGGDPKARGVLMRIMQRDGDAAKRSRAALLLQSLS